MKWVFGILVVALFPLRAFALAPEDEAGKFYIDVSADTYIRLQDPDTAMGTDVNMYEGNRVCCEDRVLLKFVLPENSTSTITGLKIHIYQYNGTSTSTVGVYKMTRNDWVENEATWNSYATGSAWATAGGDFTDSVLDSLNSFTTNTWYTFNLGTGSADFGDTVSYLIKNTSVTTDPNWLNFNPKEYSSSIRNAYLEIDYELTPVAGGTTESATTTLYFLMLVGLLIIFFFLAWLGKLVGNTPKLFYYGRLRKFLD